MDGVTHVLHLATSKETPESVMDVAVKGLFWLLEACRTSPQATPSGIFRDLGIRASGFLDPA